MQNTLFIIRGLPGSAKSTLAKQLKIANGSQLTQHFEADMFFVKDGVYKWDGNQIAEAHDWCRSSVDDALFYKQDCIVSNTFTTPKELRPYFEIAKKNNARVNVLLCQSNFGNVHDVPKESLDKMKQRFVYDLTPLFAEYNV